MFEEESSPFSILAVPQKVIDKAIDTNNGDQLGRVVDTLFRALSRIYHPDRQDGDQAMFIDISDARDEIMDDPLAVAKYYSSREHREARQRRRLLVEDRALKIEEKISIVRLLGNVNPLKVAPWLARKEALVGNSIFDSTGMPLLVALTVQENRVLTQLSAADYDGRKFIYSSQLKAWKVSTSNPDSGKHDGYIRLLTIGRGQLNIIGGIAADDAQKVQSFGQDANRHQAISAARRQPARLSWVNASNCQWLDKINPIANHDDYLVVMDIESGNQKEPLLSIIGPVLKTRSLS